MCERAGGQEKQFLHIMYDVRQSLCIVLTAWNETRERMRVGFEEVNIICYVKKHTTPAGSVKKIFSWFVGIMRLMV